MPRRLPHLLSPKSRLRNSLPKRESSRTTRQLSLESLEARQMLTQTVGLFVNDPGSFEGYTLFAPSVSGTTYLVDHAGQMVNSWQSAYGPMSAYLLSDPDDSIPGVENGDMMRAARLDNTANSINAPGASGRIELFDWEGNLKWYYELNEVNGNTPNPNDDDGIPDRRLHHDFELMPNGNVLMIAWERFPRSHALAAGRDPNLPYDNNGEVWPDMIVEVKPDYEGGVGGEIVWEWHLWDHVVQNRDSSKPNYGGIANNPHRIDLNYQPSGPGAGGVWADWTHWNAIDYNPDLDLIVVSSREFSEFWVIDHSPKTLESFPGEGTQISRGRTGGRGGMGGDILYRWGSPHTYDRGSLGSQKMAYQHDAQWIERGLPGEQNFLVFDNGWNRANRESFSAVHEVSAPDNEQWILNNNTDGSITDLVIFGTQALNYLEDFSNLDSPWSSTWVPITGNWDASAGDSAGFYDAEHNTFVMTNKTGAETAWSDLIVYAGPVGASQQWQPITGDWNGDGYDTVGLYDPQTNTWHLSDAVGAWQTEHTVVGPGVADHWLPIAGDWDNDQVDTLGLYNPLKGDWLFSNSVGAWVTAIDLPAPGAVGKDWLPVAGNWNGVGGDTVGLYDPATNSWYLNNRLDGSITDLIVMPAPADVPSTWLPVAGDWNANGRDAVGLYNPAFYALMPGRPFGPANPVWSYKSQPRSDFFATIISGAQRLPNGNTLIDEGTEGRFFEVTPDKKIVWEYKNPVSTRPNSPPGTLAYDQSIPVANFGIPGVDGNLAFRAYRYATDYIPQFENLEAQGPIERYPTYVDTPGLYDPNANDWYLNNHSDGTITDLIIFNAEANDPATWQPLAGDWNGDGHDTAGLYNAQQREFYLNNNVDGTIDLITITVNDPTIGSVWKPVAGDWDGDGVDTVGLYDPVSDNWLLNNAADAWASPLFVPRPASVPDNWVPLAGDWNGDGIDTIGLYDPASNNWYLNNKTDGTWTGNGIDGIEIVAPVRVPSSWKPITGDWNGNGRDTVGLYDPSNAKWFLNNRVDGTIKDLIIIKGRGEPATWKPIAGDWDGTRLTRPAGAEAEFVAEIAAAAWNPFNPFDVNGDANTSPIDALSVITALNQQAGDLDAPVQLAGSKNLYVDINGDQRLSPIDALLVIDHLNSNTESSTESPAEGEADLAVFALGDSPLLSVIDAGEGEAGSVASIALQTVADVTPLNSPLVGYTNPPLPTRPDDLDLDLQDDQLDELLDEFAGEVTQNWLDS